MYVEASKSVQRCPECGSARLITDLENAEIVCVDCGFVVATKIADRGPEWRAFDREQRESRARAGAPLTFTIHDKGLSTTIDWHDRDVYGKGFSSDQKAQLYRLRKWQRRIRVSREEKNLAFALSEIMKVTDKLSLPKAVSESASVIYRKVLKESLTRGRSIQGLSAAAIYLACRKSRLTRTLKDIASASNVSRKELGKSYRFLIKELNFYVPLSEPGDYISKFSNKITAALFDRTGKFEEIAHKILDAAKEIKITSGRAPRGLAAAASYIASVLTGDRVTQREIADVAGVTEVTVRNRYKEFSESLLIAMTM